MLTEPLPLPIGERFSGGLLPGLPSNQPTPQTMSRVIREISVVFSHAHVLLFFIEFSSVIFTTDTLAGGVPSPPQ